MQPLFQTYGTGGGLGEIAAVTASRRDRIRAVTPCRCAGYDIKEKG